MAKLILAIRGERDVSPLREPGLRESLEAAGATRLQLNVDDADVAPALRFGPGEPVVALALIWTDGDTTEALRVVEDAVGSCDAYGVTERVRLDPAPTRDGVRSDVVAQIALLRRPESMTREEYLDYWLLEHTPIAIRTQNTSAYIQNIVEDLLTPSSPPLAAIVEEHFPMASLDDPHAFYGSRGDDAELGRRMSEFMASVARFGADRDLDLVPTSRYAWRFDGSR
ncbi:MAG TPA: EthD domain-containing protein [Aeromicrobium sp.]|nr:EthD domain-containing protein [Aeromicrobium sp.]